MPFPVDYRGELRHRTTARARGAHLHHAVIHELATALRGANGTVTVDGSTVAFTTERYRGGVHTLLLGSIGHGSLTLTLRDDTVAVAYTLNFQPLVALASVLALGALVSVAMSAEPLAVRIGVPAIVWIVVFSVHYLITIVRFRALIRRALDRV